MLLLRAHRNPLVRSRAAAAAASAAVRLLSTAPLPTEAEPLAATLARHLGSDGKGLGLGLPLPPSREPLYKEVRYLRRAGAVAWPVGLLAAAAAAAHAPLPRRTPLSASTLPPPVAAELSRAPLLLPLQGHGLLQGLCQAGGALH
jgi:hypothetical protein